jgi:hypothetical protein
MNLLLIVGSTVSTLIAILCVYGAVLSAGVRLDRRSFL